MTRYLLLYLCALFFCQVSVAADPIFGKVVAVVDGDTLAVLTGKGEKVTVRIAGIDAPEKGQRFSSEARQALSEAVFLKEVTVEAVYVEKEGGVIGFVNADNEDIGGRQVRDGYAWGYASSLFSQRLYVSHESNARSKRSGLWRDENPKPPWEWRQAKRVADGKKIYTDINDPPVVAAAQVPVPSVAYSGTRYGSGYVGNSGGQTVHTGPRGGRYVITSSGKKRYLKKR